MQYETCSWRIDVLECPKCRGRMALVAVILAPEVAEKIIRHLGLGTRSPPAPRRPLRSAQPGPRPDVSDTPA